MGWFSLFSLGLLFLVSLLSVFKAPNRFLWFLSIITSEYPLPFTILTCLLTWWVESNTLIGIAASILFVSPVIRSYLVSRDLTRNLDSTFGFPRSTDVAKKEQPLLFWKFFTTGSVKAIPYRTLTYITHPSGISLSLDYYPAQTRNDTRSSKHPCVVVVHGGAWRTGDSKQLPELNSYLAGVGYNVAAINYRLAPMYQSPAQIEDLDAAVNYLRLHADELNVDTNQFVLLGRSAGAQMVLLAAYTLLANKGIKGVINFYGPIDLVWGYLHPCNPRIIDSCKVLANYLGGSYADTPQKYVDNSPTEFVKKETTVPTLSIQGLKDEFISIEHVRRLDKKLDENDVKHFNLILPWATHGFDFNINGPGGQLAVYTIERFLDFITTKSTN